VQPTSYPPQQQRRYPAPRVVPRLGPYPGPYAFPYPGPDRPFPEQTRRPDSESTAPPRPPVAAVLAGVLGIAGTLPLALLVGSAVALGGLEGETGVSWWLYPLLVAPILQLWGAIALLTGRSWLVQVLACLPGTALFGYLMYTTFLATGDSSTAGLGWYTLALAAPLPALLLAASPPVRRWVAVRRRRATRTTR
jgi:hypothetical protein